MSPRLLALPCYALLAACASAGGDYPSLAIRDAERVGGTMEPADAEPYVPPATPAGVIDRLTALSGEAAAAHQAFISEAPSARATVSATRGAGVGSEAWAKAEVALASIMAARSRTMLSLADLDRLYVDAATQGGEIATIAAAQGQASALVEQEDRTVDELSAALR